MSLGTCTVCGVRTSGLFAWCSTQCRLMDEIGDRALLSSNQMAELGGITYRQLDLWVREGVITPHIESAGSGHPRRWLVTQVNELRDLVERRRLAGRLLEPWPKLAERVNIERAAP